MSSSSENKDLSSIGEYCSFKTCQRLDFLPIKCTLCHLIFCKEHFSLTNHNCPSSEELNKQNLLNNSNLTPINFHKCTFEDCKQKEMVQVVCEFCKLNFCMKHRLQVDHKCAKLETLANLDSGKKQIKQEFKFEVKQNVSEKTLL